MAAQCNLVVHMIVILKEMSLKEPVPAMVEGLCYMDHAITVLLFAIPQDMAEHFILTIQLGKL